MPWIGVFLIGLAVRVGFVAWSPGKISGDALLYQLYADIFARGGGYTELDGSPAILWMPGWPYLLYLVQSVFGAEPRVGMYANAVMGALTASCLVTVGTHLFDRRVGVLAGLLYALWPGNVYYCATLFTEVSFNFFLALGLAMFAGALAPGCRRRHPRLFAASVVFCLGSMIKAEAPILLPVWLVWTWVARRSARDFVLAAIVLIAAVALVRGPWVYRNYTLLGRFIFSTSSAGMNFYIGNHKGARGGQDWVAAVENRKRYPGANMAENNLNANEGGWRDGLRFVRENPGEWLQILRRKVVRTYATDDDGVLYIRGVGIGFDSYLPLPAILSLRKTANRYWYFVLALSAVGLTTVRRWSAAARVAVLLPVLAWFAVHLVFLGEPRFHVPETLSFALLAACGLTRIGRAGGLLLGRRVESPA